MKGSTNRGRHEVARGRPRSRAPGTTLAALLAALAACRSSPPIPDELLHARPPEPTVMEGLHAGPRVARGGAGPARFVAPLFARIDPARALEDVRFIERFYRAPANEGFETVLEHVAARLRAAGFGSEPGFELEFLESDLDARGWMQDGRVAAEAWTPVRARLALVAANGEERVLHAFDSPEDADRTMLSVHAPSADVAGAISLGLDTLDAGEVLVTSAAPVPSVLKRAHELGAVAVVSSYLEAYNADPRGTGREQDAIQFSTLPFGTPIPVARVSPRSYEAIVAAPDGTRLAFQAETRFEPRKLRTLVARVAGRDRPGEAVSIASHVQEPGACDNATGVAGLVESAIALAAAIEAGEIQRPSRTLVFLWGDEFRQTSVWLDRTPLAPVAGFSSDMTGESAELTGAIALLERMPDPAAITPLAPDEHTPWGARPVDTSALVPNGVAIVARCALFDVAAHDAGSGGWKTAEHPYEGGSDHDILIERRIPAALFWHFTDFTYHTSLDRLEYVDATEIRRTATAILAAALALADPRPDDLERYLGSLNEELTLRTRAAAEAGDEPLAQNWRDWCVGARHWLRTECLRLPPAAGSNP